ncbi:hypothetical protein QUB70_05830 [Microcoleus sp. A003_D6]
MTIKLKFPEAGNLSLASKPWYIVLSVTPELSVGKRRTINVDRTRDRNVPAPETEAIAARLQELLSPKCLWRC